MSAPAVLHAFSGALHRLALHHHKNLGLPLASDPAFLSTDILREVFLGEISLVKFDGIAQLVLSIPLTHYASEFMEHLSNRLIPLLTELTLQF